MKYKMLVDLISINTPQLKNKGKKIIFKEITR